MIKQKKEKPDDRKEIKILRVIRENPIREIKKEERIEEEVKEEKFEDFDEFISGEGERPVSLLRSGQVQNLEQDLAMVPSPVAEREEEEDAVKYGRGLGGKGGYGDFSYDANKDYKGSMEQTLPTDLSGGGRQFVAPRDVEAERVQEATRGVQDKVMDYTSRVETGETREEKKKKMEW